MKKNLDILKKFKNLQEKINNLDKNKIYLIYYDYSICFGNLYHSPLMLSTKFLSFLTGKKDIDHVCHISRFVFDNETGMWSSDETIINTILGLYKDFLRSLEFFSEPE
jgi:hypothetical protein